MEITITFALLTALVVGLVEAIKRLGLNERFCPLVSIIIGILLCWVSGLTMPEVLIGGLMMGLGAVGLFSGVKNTIEKNCLCAVENSSKSKVFSYLKFIKHIIEFIE